MSLYLGELLVERVLEGVGRGIVSDAVAVSAVDGVGGADAGAACGAAETAVAADATRARARGSVFAVRVCIRTRTIHKVVLYSVHIIYVISSNIISEKMSSV